LNWIIDRVIRQKRTRGFLVNQSAAGAPLLLALFDARVLHLIRKGYSAQGKPGERYDVYVIDYGAFVDLIQTNYAHRTVPEGPLAGTAVAVCTFLAVLACGIDAKVAHAACVYVRSNSGGLWISAHLLIKLPKRTSF
jgi:hypothetical protein